MSVYYDGEHKRTTRVKTSSPLLRDSSSGRMRIGKSDQADTKYASVVVDELSLSDN